MARKVDPRSVFAELRAFALSLPETSEVEAWGHPNFRAGRRTFAAFEVVQGRPSIAVKLPRPDGEALLGDPRFFRTPYGGKHGWVSVWVDLPLARGFVQDLVLRSYRGVANRRMLGTLAAPGGARPSAGRKPRSAPRSTGRPRARPG